MSAFKSLAAGAIFSLISLPALAQAVISEPGYCAFFYPNANCQNKGPGNPYTGNYQGTPGYYGYGSYGAAPRAQIPGQTVGIAPTRKPRPHHTTTRKQ